MSCNVCMCLSKGLSNMNSMSAQRTCTRIVEILHYEGSSGSIKLLLLYRVFSDRDPPISVPKRKQPSLGKPSLKKIYFAKKFHKRGEEGIWISYLYFFLQYNLNAPKYRPKKISFHKTPMGEGGHRFMKLFSKIDFFFKGWLS